MYVTVCALILHCLFHQNIGFRSNNIHCVPNYFLQSEALITLVFFSIFTDSGEKQLCEYLLSCATLLYGLGQSHKWHER